MKRISKLLAALLFFSITSTEQAKSYEIKGNIKNLAARKVYMVTMKRYANGTKVNWPVIDSAQVNAGEFKLLRDTVMAEPGWSTTIYYTDTITKKFRELLISNQYNPKQAYSTFILENTQMTLTGDVKDLSGLSLTGSAETDILFRYGILSPRLSKLNEKIELVKKKGSKIELSKAVALRNDSLTSFKNKLFSLSRENPQSWMMLMNVYQNEELLSPAELADMTKIFSAEVMSTPKGRKLAEYEQRSKSVLSGATFPAFSYKDPNKNNRTLSNVKGEKGTVVVFWASWCGPCRAEIPELKKVYKDYKAKGINLVSISVDHDYSAWQKALKTESMPWSNVSNLPGDKDEIYRKYNLTAVPAIFLLDANNNIVMTNDYQVSVLRMHLNKLLAQ